MQSRVGSGGAADDVDRPLAARGERDAPKMGERLAAAGCVPGASRSRAHAARAVRTARLAATELDQAAATASQTTPTLYLASPDEILDVVAALDDDLVRLLLVGHNPGLTELANRLLPDFAARQSADSGVVVIDYPYDELARNRHGGEPARAIYDFPKNRELTSRRTDAAPVSRPQQQPTRALVRPAQRGGGGASARGPRPRRAAPLDRLLGFRVAARPRSPALAAPGSRRSSPRVVAPRAEPIVTASPELHVVRGLHRGRSDARARRAPPRRRRSAT